MGWYNNGNWRESDNVPVEKLAIISENISAAIHERASAAGIPCSMGSYYSGNPTHVLKTTIDNARQWITYLILEGTQMVFVNPNTYAPFANIGELLSLGSYGSSWVEATRAQQAFVWLQIKEAIQNLRIAALWCTIVDEPRRSLAKIGVSWGRPESWTEMISATPEIEGEGGQWGNVGETTIPTAEARIRRTHLFSPGYYCFAEERRLSDVDPISPAMFEFPSYGLTLTVLQQYKTVVTWATTCYTGGITVELDGETYTPSPGAARAYYTMPPNWQALDTPFAMLPTFSVLPETDPFPNYELSDSVYDNFGTGADDVYFLVHMDPYPGQETTFPIAERTRSIVDCSASFVYT